MTWDIAKTSPHCASCGRTFEEQEIIFSALLDDSNGFCRKDFCRECWPSQDLDTALGQWRTRSRRLEAPSRPLVGDEELLDLFRGLEGTSEPERQGFRYVLALLLVRKKLMQFRGYARTGGGARLRLYDRKEGREYVVDDPGLSADDLQRVAQEVSRIFNTRFLPAHLSATPERDTT